MKTIPSRITLHYGRLPGFQYAPELLSDVVVPDDVYISHKWVIVGSAKDIEQIIAQGGETMIEVGGRRWPSDKSRPQHGKTYAITLVGIVGIRYVNHRDHPRTRYLAASVRRFTHEDRLMWYHNRPRSTTRG